MQPTNEDTHLEEFEEMRSRLDVLTAQISSLSTKLEEKDREMVFQESQLKEMKNMNAALENQLTEYMDALELQNKVLDLINKSNPLAINRHTGLDVKMKVTQCTGHYMYMYIHV